MTIVHYIGVGTGPRPGPCPGTFSVPGTESRIFQTLGQFRLFESWNSAPKIPQFLNLSPGPRPRFPGPGLRDPGDPVPDTDP